MPKSIYKLLFLRGEVPQKEAPPIHRKGWDPQGLQCFAHQIKCIIPSLETQGIGELDLECYAHRIKCIMPSLETQGIGELDGWKFDERGPLIGKKPLTQVSFTQVHFILELRSILDPTKIIILRWCLDKSYLEHQSYNKLLVKILSCNDLAKVAHECRIQV